ncbi:unnamed protein product [Rhizophagus irregularis]|nr:unnamed protein product [Rhizophagus irregularis]CAB5380343.1 unnamed protein product [Rhizophagus irregularis]
MSNDRCACITHQQALARNHFYKNIKPKDDKPSRHMTEEFINDKSSHANLLYHRWLSGQPKHNYSKRTGISYISSIHARDNKSIVNLGNKFMYRKVLSNFQRIFSPNPHTQQKQEKRFVRSCRHVFNKMRLPPGRPAQNSDYLAIARKYRFIFLKNQYVKNSIRHLSYKKVFTEPNPEDYPFLVPFYATSQRIENRTWKNINSLKKHINQPTRLTISTDPSNPIAPYNPIPNMFIPEKYHDIIPKDPIYVNDQFIIPGSREWFTYMHNLEKSIREQEEIDFYARVDREVEEGFKQAAEEKAARWAQEKIIHQELLEKKKEKEIKEAMYHGTTIKYLKARQERIKTLTNTTNNFHNYFLDYLKRKKTMENTDIDTIHDPLVVSDDTANFELRPNKRNINDSRNSSSFYTNVLIKHFHPAPNNDNDSSKAGPSNST